MQRGDPHRAGPAQRCVEDCVVTDHRAGMRDRRAVPGRPPSGFDHDHGLVLRRGAQPAHERTRVVDTFDVEQNRVGRGVERKAVEHLSDAHVRGRAE